MCHLFHIPLQPQKNGSDSEKVPVVGRRLENLVLTDDNKPTSHPVNGTASDTPPGGAHMPMCEYTSDLHSPRIVNLWTNTCFVPTLFCVCFLWIINTAEKPVAIFIFVSEYVLEVVVIYFCL